MYHSLVYFSTLLDFSKSFRFYQSFKRFYLRAHLVNQVRSKKRIFCFLHILHLLRDSALLYFHFKFYPEFWSNTAISCKSKPTLNKNQVLLRCCGRWHILCHKMITFPEKDTTQQKYTKHLALKHWCNHYIAYRIQNL